MRLTRFGNAVYTSYNHPHPHGNAKYHLSSTFIHSPLKETPSLNALSQQPLIIDSFKETSRSTPQRLSLILYRGYTKVSRSLATHRPTNWKAVPNIHRYSKHTTIRPTTSVRFSSTNIHHLPFAMTLSPHHIEQHDARGLLIPDDVVKYSGSLRIRRPSGHLISFMSKDFRKTCYQLSRQFLTITSTSYGALCFLIFGWNPPSGPFSDPYRCCGRRKYCRSCASTIKSEIRELDELIEHVMHRGNKTLVVKILWSTSMSISLERLCTWRKDKQRYEYKNVESHSAQFRRFNAQFKALGYDETLVRSYCQSRLERFHAATDGG